MDKQPESVKQKQDKPAVVVERAAAAGGKMAIPQRQLEQMRPTLVIGAGGSGQFILTCLKGILQGSYGDQWRQRIRLLAFDTTEEAFQVQGPSGLVALEPNDEFYDIGNVPVGSIMHNIDRQKTIKERLGPVMAKLPAGVLRSGSKQIRAFGLMALLWNYTIVDEQLQRALWKLAGRHQADAAVTQQQGINVFICGSLVGGTGSGIMLDLAHLVRDRFTNLGTQAEFCHLTGVGILPQAFYGIKGPNMLPNTGAFLQELNHLMVKGDFQARYTDGRLVQSREAPFDIFYVVDGIDQSGRTWPDVYAVAAMTAQCIYLQMATQLGRKGENDFDNLDEVLSGLAADGQGTFLGSFGKGDLVFDAPAVAGICTRWYLVELLQQIWLQPADPGMVRQHTEPLLDTIRGERIRPLLLHDPETEGDLQHDLVQPGWLRRKPAAEVAGEAARYVTDYGQARVAEKMLPQIGRNGQALAAARRQQWTTWLQSLLFTSQVSLSTLLAILQRLGDHLGERVKMAQKAVAEQERLQARQEQAVAQLETALSKAAASFPFGRRGRIHGALDRYFRAAQALYHVQTALHVARAELATWHELHHWSRTHATGISRLRERLVSLATQIEMEAGRQMQQVAAGGVATISLADFTYVQKVYGRFKPAWASIRDRLGDPLSLCHLEAAGLARHLLDALRPHFKGIAAMTVEEVVKERTAEMSPRARQQQLFQLATPSWNLDRARLPDGGAGLVRLEVLGVPDATASLFEGGPTLVSTHDAHRLTALVVAAGAPPSALQQHALYVQAMAQVQGKRPLHILPDFLVTADQGQLVFALASIFGLIYSQGTFFYYRPADSLENPLKLANGLGNAIQAFSEQEGLINETRERVEREIARLGLREAISILADYYNSIPEGNTALDEQLRQLKRLVRDYTDGLRRIDAFSAGINDTTGP